MDDPVVMKEYDGGDLCELKRPTNAEGGFVNTHHLRGPHFGSTTSRVSKEAIRGMAYMAIKTRCWLRG